MLFFINFIYRIFKNYKVELKDQITFYLILIEPVVFILVKKVNKTNIIKTENFFKITRLLKVGTLLNLKLTFFILLSFNFLACSY